MSCRHVICVTHMSPSPSMEIASVTAVIIPVFSGWTWWYLMLPAPEFFFWLNFITTNEILATLNPHVSTAWLCAQIWPCFQNTLHVNTILNVKLNDSKAMRDQTIRHWTVQQNSLFFNQHWAMNAHVLSHPTLYTCSLSFLSKLIHLFQSPSSILSNSLEGTSEGLH